MIKEFRELMRWFAHFAMRGRNILLFFGLYVLMIALVMNWGATKITALAGKPLQPLDLYFSYTPAHAYALIGEYGEAARNFYALFEMTADVAYPLIYTLLLCTLIGHAWKIVIEEKFRYAVLIFVPFLTLFFDLCENICIVSLLKNYPTPVDWLVNLSSIFTSLKWITVVLCLVVLVVGMGTRIAKGKFLSK
jgi:hypothetical protein